jgi:ATP-dependent Clp endopeptidase proteolytic subunit ClpP
MKSWYKVNVVTRKNATSEAEISIYDEIGEYGVDAIAFKNDFDKVKGLGNIKVLINSPGGSVFDGLTIYNMLADVRGKVTVEVQGVAASIASIIAMAGDKRIMREGTFMMIHNPWTMMIGDSEDLRKEADVLDGIKEQLVGIYSRNTGMAAQDVEALMKEETWLSPTQAKALGFAHEVTEAPRIAASFNKNIGAYGFNHTPYSEVKSDVVKDLVNELTEPIPNADITPVDQVVEVDTTADQELADRLKAKILQFKIENKLKQKK